MTIADCRLLIADCRLLIAAALFTAACGQPQQPAEQPRPESPSVDVVELSATDARDRMAKGELTSEALTQAYLKRIAEVDDGGPRLGSVIEINSKAEDEARAGAAEPPGPQVGAALPRHPRP